MKKYAVIILLILTSCKKDLAKTDMSPIDAKGEILFISRRVSNSADWQMLIMNADGTGQRKVSESLVRCTPPVLSNNKALIAFTTYENLYYGLYIVGKDGKNQQLLTTAIQYCGSPAFSPDDSKIVFVKNDSPSGGNYDIYSIDIDGGNETRLTNQNDNYSPSFYSMGPTIIYTSANAAFSGIYKMNGDGSGKRLLSLSGMPAGNAVASPGGNKIAFTATVNNSSQLFIMNADGSQIKQLTFTVSSRYFPGAGREGNCNPVWSPNSNKIAYVSFENGSPDIFTINSDGSENRRLTDSPLRDENPVWSKDGKYILFSSNRNMSLSSEIYIMRNEGQLQTPLTNFIADDIYPIFIER